jgi:NADH-quinone oxidoreductase subunit N
LLILAGFSFKISAAPFHFWAPDIYEGAPTSVAGFLSTASKAAGFAVLLRMVAILIGAEHALIWQLLLAIMATASMFIGNLLAIPQKNIKRLIAYSSIAQAGYILVGAASGTEFGFTGAVYYLMAYLLTNLAVFAIIGWVEKSAGSTNLAAFAGLHKRSPGMAMALLVGLLSLGGIPPFSGFFAKLLVFGAAIEGNMAWLAIIGIVNSVIGLYYYLRILKVMFVDEPLATFTTTKRPFKWTGALLFCLVGIIVLGMLFTPWFRFASLAGAGF